MKISNRQIVKSATIDLPVAEVWKKWTTHDGLLSFFGEDNRIELTPGGAFEIYFLMDNPQGLRGSEGCKILSFLPQKMLSFTWNAPPDFPEIRQSDYHTWVVVLFHSLDGFQTKVTLTHLGWPDDIRWHPVYDYFERAWGVVLDWLKNGRPDQ